MERIVDNGLSHWFFDLGLITGVLLQTTWYVGGMIYVQTGTGNPVPEEYAIDGGGGRIGTFYKQDNVYAYELRDQLGNVRATIAQSGTSLEVRGYSDYYPYGMVLRSGGTTYRYGYQGAYAEKDGETDWNAFELRMHDSRIARWMAPDPRGGGYVAMSNNPTNLVDPRGDTAIFTGDFQNGSPIFENPDDMLPTVNVITSGGRSSYTYSQFAAYYDIGRENGLSDYDLQKNAPKAFPDMSSNEWSIYNGNVLDMLIFSERPICIRLQQTRK